MRDFTDAELVAMTKQADFGDIEIASDGDVDYRAAALARIRHLLTLVEAKSREVPVSFDFHRAVCNLKLSIEYDISRDEFSILVKRVTSGHIRYVRIPFERSPWERIRKMIEESAGDAET